MPLNMFGQASPIIATLAVQRPPCYTPAIMCGARWSRPQDVCDRFGVELNAMPLHPKFSGGGHAPCAAFALRSVAPSSLLGGGGGDDDDDDDWDLSPEVAARLAALDEPDDEGDGGGGLDYVGGEVGVAAAAAADDNDGGFAIGSFAGVGGDDDDDDDWDLSPELFARLEEAAGAPDDDDAEADGGDADDAPDLAAEVPERDDELVELSKQARARCYFFFFFSSFPPSRAEQSRAEQSRHEQTRARAPVQWETACIAAWAAGV